MHPNLPNGLNKLFASQLLTYSALAVALTSSIPTSGAEVQILAGMFGWMPFSEFLAASLAFGGFVMGLTGLIQCGKTNWKFYLLSFLTVACAAGSFAEDIAIFDISSKTLLNLVQMGIGFFALQYAVESLKQSGSYILAENAQDLVRSFLIMCAASLLLFLGIRLGLEGDAAALLCGTLSVLPGLNYVFAYHRFAQHFYGVYA